MLAFESKDFIQIEIKRPTRAAFELLRVIITEVRAIQNDVHDIQSSACAVEVICIHRRQYGEKYIMRFKRRFIQECTLWLAGPFRIARTSPLS